MNLKKILPDGMLSLSVNTPAGICNPLSNGVKTPIHGVFYCPKEIIAPLVRVFVMVARVVGSRKAGRLHCPVLQTCYTRRRPNDLQRLAAVYILSNGATV